MYFDRLLNTIPHKVLYADVNRDYLDLNREVSRDSPFRQELRDLLVKHPLFILDIHSFPADQPGEFKDSDVALGSENYELEPYLIDMVDYLHDKDINAIAVGNIICDIVVEAKTYDIPSYLIEFNEGVDREKREQIIGWIIEYLMETYYEESDL